MFVITVSKATRLTSQETTSGQAFNTMLFFAFGKHQHFFPSFSSFYIKVPSTERKQLPRLFLLIVIEQILQSFQTDILTHQDGIAGKYPFLLLDYGLSK